MKARARSSPNRDANAEEETEKKDGTVTTWSMDYCFITEEAVNDENVPDGDERIQDTIMVCHDKRTGGVQSYLVQCKGKATRGSRAGS